jgi:hypothetical protein
MLQKRVECCCAYAAKRAERFGFAFIFGSIFLPQGKKWKTYTKRIDINSKAATSRCRVEQGMTAKEKER